MLLIHVPQARLAMTNPGPVAFTLFGYSVYWYGVLMALGILLAFALVNHEVKRKKLHSDMAYDICLVTIPLGLIGARLYYVLFNLEYYMSDPVRMLYVWEGGLAIYGAAIGGLIGLAFYAKKKKIRLLTLLDVCAPGLVLAQAIGRWGNFFNQEAYGPLVTNPKHMWFPLSVLIDATGEIHYATFFYESLWCLFIFLFLWFVLRKRQKRTGDVFLWYMLLYAFERMFVEGLRQDSLYLFGTIRISQLLSAAIVTVAAACLIARAVRMKKAPSESGETFEDMEEAPLDTAEIDAGQDPDGTKARAAEDGLQAPDSPETADPAAVEDEAVSEKPCEDEAEGSMEEAMAPEPSMPRAEEAEEASRQQE